MNDFGYAQSSPADAGDPYNVADFHIQQALARISTMKIVKVTAVNASAMTVDVQPLVNQLDGQGNQTPHGQVLATPYLQFQWGTWAVVATPVVGDMGIMICADRDISSAVAAKGQANPGSRRKLDWADGVYLGGLLNPTPTQKLSLTPQGFSVTDANSNSITTSSSGLVLGSALMSMTLDAATGNVRFAGSGAAGIYFNNVKIIVP